MTGSGNDFVFFDGRSVPLALVSDPVAVSAICDRHNGVGADGVVILEPRPSDDSVAIHYFNSDGSPADLCGNATLCSTALAVELGLAPAGDMRLVTGAGLIRSRIGQVGHERLPAIDLQPIENVQSDVPLPLGPTEHRIGFAVAGIPHLVVLCADADAIALDARGPTLRWAQATGIGDAGANVNWVSPSVGGAWRYRTFERGVEGETLACGTGAVATAVLLAEWGLVAEPQVSIRSSSGRLLHVRLQREGGRYRPTLQGEGRIVFRGHLGELGQQR